MKAVFKILFLFILLGNTLTQVQAQDKKNKFSLYGGFGLGVSTDYFYVSLQPGVIYHLSQQFKLGSGLQYSYMKSNKNYYGVNYKYHILGFNAMALYYPIKQIELSGEYEDLYVMQSYNSVKDRYWSPALFAGIAYRYNNVAAGFKYNLLHEQGRSVYQDAFVPFIRIYF